MDLKDIKYEKKPVIEFLSNTEKELMYSYTNEYIKFLKKAKTEYKCVEYILKEIKEQGFVDILSRDELNAGDKVYYINKDRALFMAIVGEDKLINGFNIVGAHIDSPRLDTKPLPLYETQNLALMKTQYYGGIKDYQWLSIPLAMYAVIYTSEGEKLDLVIGEQDDDPVFTIADLLPHLSREELSKKASEFIDPENLAVIVGSMKDKDTDKESVKGAILKLLNRKYGIKEIDFARSDIRFVPAFEPRYVGFDKGLVAGYGHDDRVCSYAMVAALLNIAKNTNVPCKTMIGLLVDKEEIGSEGATSMQSETFDLFVELLLSKTGTTKDLSLAKHEALSASIMLSSDVSAAVDPTHESLSDIQNGNIIGCGISIEKYTGSGGKYSANDASAKFVNKVMQIFDRANIVYQFGTLGKIGKGGGGTIAYILANKGVEVIDCGTALLAMHSPFELASVADIYMTYKAYKAFFLEN